MIPINDPERNLRADVTPIEIDQSVDWDKVGGLDQHINALKEMVMFPLMYPELFERFSVTPPKGVLFYGPPGMRY
jgi:ATP-dependent 26S proteasome regulatory subunit